MYQLGSWADPFIIQCTPKIKVRGITVSTPLYEVARIHFQTGSSSLDKRDKLCLDFLSKAYWPLLSTWPMPIKFYFVGYADERGTDSSNRELSWRRAYAVGNCLKKSLLLTSPSPLYKPVFVMDGAGEAKGLGLTHRDRLARWRRVSIYANISGNPIKECIRRLKQELRKAAENATTKFPKVLENYRELVDEYKRRQGGRYDSLTGWNTGWLAWYETRLNEREKRYEELKKALALGDIAFHNWMNKSRIPYKEFVRRYTTRLQEEIIRLKVEEQKAPSEMKALIREIIKGLEHDIFSIKDELKHIVPIS